jgi:hypothetical protein
MNDSICKSAPSGFGDKVIDAALAKAMAIRGTFVMLMLYELQRREELDRQIDELALLPPLVQTASQRHDGLLRLLEAEPMAAP